MNLNEVFFRRQSPSMRRIYALTAYIIYSGDDETEFSKKLNFPETADSSEIAQPRYPLIVPVAIQTLSSESKPTLAKVPSGFASPDPHPLFNDGARLTWPGRSSRVVSFH
jgi:hypothetical protein